jgi:hypothetical protein
MNIIVKASEDTMLMCELQNSGHLVQPVQLFLD